MIELLGVILFGFVVAWLYVKYLGTKDICVDCKKRIKKGDVICHDCSYFPR